MSFLKLLTKQPRRRPRQKRHKFAYLTMIKGTFACSARACFVVCTFRSRSRHQRHEVTCFAVVRKAACKCTGFDHCTSSQHVECLLSAVFRWPQQLLNMLSSPKISQRLMLNHGWESLDTLATARAWAQHVERWIAVQMHSTLLSQAWMTAKERKCWAVLSEKFASTPLNRVFKCAQLVELNMLRACTVEKSSAFARGLRSVYLTNKCQSFCFLHSAHNHLFQAS